MTNHTAEDIARALEKPRRSGTGWTACCPAHDDTDPSLSISDGADGRILLHCFTGCQFADIAAALKARGIELNGSSGPAAGPDPPTTHPELGPYEQHWDYFSRYGMRVLRICRWDPPSGKKEIRPLTQTPDGWRWKQLPNARPLFHLPELLASDTMPVLVVEGERTAAAAQLLLPQFVVTTWAGGVNAVGHTDWSTLAKRRCLLVPDADEPGRGAMAAIATILGQIKAEVLIADSSGYPEGWDIADALTDEDKSGVKEWLAEYAWEAPKALWPEPANLEELLSREPEKPRMLINDWLPAGYATLLAGHGGSGKSTVGLHLAACIALGRAWWGMGTTQRRVVYLSCEDRIDTVHWRLDRLCRREGFQAKQFAGRLLIRDLVGLDTLLYRTTFGDLSQTAAYSELARIMAEDPAAVLMIDGVADTYGGNENDRSQVKSFVNGLVRLISVDGSVILFHHVNKISANAGAQTEGYSGSTGWHNSVRARWYLRPEIETNEDGKATRASGRLVLELQKTNLGVPDQQLALRWDEDAHMFIADEPATRFDSALAETEERAGILRAMRDIITSGGTVPAAAQGPRTTLHVLAAVPGFPDSLKMGPGKRRFWRHIEGLRRVGHISESSIRRADRHYVRIFILGEPHES